MKKIILLLVVLSCYQAQGQNYAIVARNPAWVTMETSKTAAERADRMQQLLQLSATVNAANENLKIVKDATKKLVEINRKIANYRNLETALVLVQDAYSRVNRTLRTINEHNCFTPTEYRQITESLMGLVAQTSYAVTSLTVVLTDNFSSMGDGERLNNMNQALRDLQDQMGVINAAIIQVELLDNQRMQIRTLKYLNTVFK